jgi:hypothetical protein
MTITITWDDVWTVLKYGAAFVAGGAVTLLFVLATIGKMLRR